MREDLKVALEEIIKDMNARGNIRYVSELTSTLYGYIRTEQGSQIELDFSYRNTEGSYLEEKIFEKLLLKTNYFSNLETLIDIEVDYDCEFQYITYTAFFKES